ncbi:MAG: 16S rRNA (cytosine(1402)-N(4))-methyltransferase RsmH [Prevotella sp.]|nr:16S rRNA (cytosine(1402)-N(4))-methyltransferase RsmH [Prevotella sp.]
MATTAETYHVPVLLKESVDGLDIKPDGIYVDVTFGGGGHSREILRRLGPEGRLFSFDQDEDAEQNIVDDSRLTFVRSNFRYLKNWMRYYDVEHIDGLLADLGVSSHHFDDAERGFSFRFDAPLDMRMNKRARYTAANVLAEYDEGQLADIFYLYGELKQARRLASAVVKARSEQPIATTQDLMRIAESILGRGARNDDRGLKKDMAKVFQALRIEVNREMVALRQMLLAATDLLRDGGRLSVITYHSLEDRMVKNVMKSGNVEGRVKQDFFGRVESPFTLVNNKVITPDNDEQERNPRSRSAKLRIGMKNGDRS